MKLPKDILGKVLCLRTVFDNLGLYNAKKKRFLCEYRSTDDIKQKKQDRKQNNSKQDHNRCKTIQIKTVLKDPHSGINQCNTLLTII